MDINDQYEFFKNVKLTEDGYLIVSGSGGGGGTVEITINGNLYKIINAPNVENIRVIDQYDDEVGSIINGEFVVPIPQFIKPDISINSVPYKEYESGAIDNIKVKDQNGNEVGSLVGDEWIVNQPTFVDVSISINNIPYKLYNSGDSDNILVVDQDGNQIGSLIGTSWTVNLPVFTDVDVSINSINMGSYGSGMAPNILVKDQDGNQVGSKSGSDWVVNVPTFTDVELSINNTPIDTYGSGDTPNILVKDQNDNTVGSKVGGEWIVQIPTFTDAEISINGVFYDAYSSGESDNILIVDQNTNQIGSLDLISGNWVVNLPTFTKTKTSINGVQFNELDSGQTDNILIKDQNGNLIGSKVLDEWIVNLPTFTATETSINGTLMNTLDSGQTSNILVRDQNNNQIGTKDGNNWKVTLPTFTDVELSINNTLIDTYGSGTTPNILVKDEDDNQVGSLISGEWIVPSGGSEPTYVKSLILGARDQFNLYTVLDVYSNGFIKSNETYKIPQTDITSPYFNFISVDINPNTGTIISGRGVLSSDSIGCIMRSVDNGETWTTAYKNTSYLSCRSVMYDEDLDAWYAYVATNTGSNTGGQRVLKSVNDGVSWSTVLTNNYVTPANANVQVMNNINKIGNYYYLYGGSSSSSNNYRYLHYSLTPDNFNNADRIWDTTTGVDIVDMIYGNGIYLFITNSGGIIRSVDGTTIWNTINPVSGGTYYCAGYHEILSTFVCLISDTSGTYLYNSSDGISWTKSHTFVGNSNYSFNRFTKMYFDGEYLNITGGFNVKSTDLVNWITNSVSSNEITSIREKDLSGLM